MITLKLILLPIAPRFPGTQPILIVGNSTTPVSNSTVTEVKVVVDDFAIDSEPVVIVLAAVAPPSVAGSNFQQQSNILGGERDITLTVLTGSVGRVFTAGVSDGQFVIACPNGASGSVVVQYDGVDGSANLSLTPGLGGLDLTASNGVGFKVSATSDISTSFSVTAYSGNGNKGSVSKTVVGNPDVVTDYLIAFSEYPSTVDFTDIVALELTVNANENVDFFINTFVTYGEVTNSIGFGSFEGSVLPCDLDYYRLQTLTNLNPGDYIKIVFNQTINSNSTSVGTLYITSSDYTDLQAELASNTNIVDTLGELPGPENYIYKCDVAYCEIEITSCQLEETTYYFAIAGSDSDIVYYRGDIYLRNAPIFQLFAQTPQPVFLDQRPAEPNDHTLYYRYYAIDIPESLYSEGTYLVVNISRAEPFPGLEMRLNYGGLPESASNTGVIGTTDFDSDGNQVDDCTYQYCVDVSRPSDKDPYFENPIASNPRVPCVCTTQPQFIGTSGAFQLTCNLTVDPCQFQYGTWYISVLLPPYSADNTTIDTANYTLTPYIVQPTVTTLFRNVTTKGAVVPERTTHYKLEVPASDVSLGESHLLVQLSNVRNGYVDLWVHQGLGGNNNLAGGPEACVPANATCHTRAACNVVIEKCHFTPGTWYIAVSIAYDESTKLFEDFDTDRLPITYTIRANWLEDPTPTPLLAGIPVISSIGEALYDFYVVDIPPTVDTWLFIELYSRCQDTEVILSVLHGSLPGGECYERPDFYCLTGDPREVTYTSHLAGNFPVYSPVSRQSCTFMIQTCELEAGPLYLSVYGHHNDYLYYGDNTYYQIPVKYTLYVDFDTATPLISNVSYSDNVVNHQYQHYYIRADQVKQGSYLTVEVTNIQHGIPQTIEAFVNYNYLAGNCPCYDHLYNCTGVPRYGYTGPVDSSEPNYIPAPECLDTCCTVVVPPSDFRSGVWYIAVLGVNQDLVRYTTPIGYTLTVTIHDAPTFIPLFLGQSEVATVPQWNKTLEYTHFKVAAVPLPLNDLVLKINYVQNCEYLAKHDNLRDTLVMYVRADASATELGYDYTCSAKIQSESYCTIVIPHCEWKSNDYFVAVKGDYDADFIGRFTIRAYLEEVRDFQLTSGVYTYDRVEYGTYKHFFIDSENIQYKHLYINLYTNQDQDPVSVFLNIDTRAGTAPCFDSIDSCDGSFCSFRVDAWDLVSGRYYVSVYGGAHQWYDVSVEFSLVAEFKQFATELENGDPFTNHVLVGEHQYYRFPVTRQQTGDYLTIEVENVDFGSVAVYVNFGTAAGRCPGYLYEYSCSASYDNVEWCEVRIPSCELQLGDYYITVVGLENQSPCEDAHHKIGYNIEVNQITPFLLTPEVDVGRDTTNTLVFEFLPNTRYAHYQFRYTEEDYTNGYHIIVEITRVREGSLFVYYNKGHPSDADTDCQLAQICTDGLGVGQNCYWQIPFSLSKPTYADAEETTVEFQYITVEALGGRFESSYSILIWKQPVPSIIANPTFTLDNTNSSFFFPANTELNVTHFSQDEPYGWAQFIQLTDVPAHTEGDVLEVFFYRITNNIAESTAFNVYLFPEIPAGAHECCDHDPSTLGSCENAPTLRTVETTTQVGSGAETISHFCENPVGTGYDATGTIPFYGSRCTVRVWPCEFSRYCENATTWWLSVVPVDPNAGYATIPLAGLSYSLQWRVRNIRLNENFQVDSISLNKYINQYNYTDAIPVYSNHTEDEGWLSLYIDVVPSNSRISIQTDFINGTSAVYIQPDSFASPPFDHCNYYYCVSNDPNSFCAGSGRFISNECHSNLYSRYYITVRNLSGPDTISLVSFRIIKIDQPATVVIPAHLTSASPFTSNSTIFSAFNVSGVEGENYDTYVLPIDDNDFIDHQSLIIDVQRPTIDAGRLALYVRYGAQAGEYTASGHSFYPDPEGCYSWLYECDLSLAGDRCTLQIPHTELTQGYWYISIYNPDFLYDGVSADLPDYTLTVLMQDAPVYLTLNVPYGVTNSSIPVAFPGTFLNFRLNLTAQEIGLEGGNTTGNLYSGDYYTNYLRFVLEGINGDVTMYINYDDVAGERSAFYNPYGYYQQSLDYIASVSCTEGNSCYVDFTPCESFNLLSGIYYVSLLDYTSTTYNITAYLLTDEYEILAPVTDLGTGDRAGTTNTVWSVSVTNTTAHGDGDYYYRYTVDANEDVKENNYFFVNITVPFNETVQGDLYLDVWRDDCTRFTCNVPLNDGSSWCIIDALTLAPCSIKTGRFYFKVYNPNDLPFTLNFYRNETTVQTLLNEQVITEIVYPYEYQEYYFEAVDVLQGATLAVQVCADCGEVEAWIRPNFPAGPGPDGTGYEYSCGLDHCTASGDALTELYSNDDFDNCCYMFLDTCQFAQQGYYIAVRGVSTSFPRNNPHLYLPARYQIQVIQTNVKVNEIDFVCPATVSYDVAPNQVPQQFAIDLETANVGAQLRFTLILPDPSVYTPDTLQYATLSISQNRTVGYTSACENSAYSCVIASTDDTYKCDFIIPAVDVVTGRYYIWADAPRGSQVIVERWDPYIPIVQTNLLYTASINGPDTGYIFDSPFRPQTQYYRFDLEFDDDDFDNYDETFFLRVYIKDVKHGSLSASLNSGYFPLTEVSASKPAPRFLNNLSCSLATDGYDCHIDLQLCDIWGQPDDSDSVDQDTDDDDDVDSNTRISTVKTFWLTITGLQQLAELHSIQYSFVVQTNWIFTYFPLGHTICDEVVEDEYRFYRLRPHAKEDPQQSILRVSISDIDVVNGAEVEFFLQDYSVPTVDCYDLAYRSGRAVSNNDAVGVGVIDIDWICSYDNLYLSVYGINSAVIDGTIDYRMRVESIPVKVKELFNDNVYHSDDDDDDACGSVGDEDQDYPYDFYIFRTVATNDRHTAFLRVAVDSDYPFTVYVNKGGFAHEECNVASGSAQHGTLNLYDFCGYEDTDYFITVESEGPYYIFTNIRDDAVNLTLGEVYRDTLEQGQYQIYTVEVCKDWFAADDRLVIEIADVENSGVYGWINLNQNPDPFQDCLIPNSNAFAQYGPGETGFDFILVDHTQLLPGTYHILIQAQSIREQDDDDTDTNPQFVNFRLFPYLQDLEIEPTPVAPNSVVASQVVDYYTLGRNGFLTPTRTAYYRIDPLINGYEDSIAFAQVRLQNVQGGLVTIRVASGHLATPPADYIVGELNGLTHDYVYPGNIETGRRPHTFQYITDARQSQYYPECDGGADFCAIMHFDDVEHYSTDSSAAVWIPSCYFTLAEPLYISVQADEQYFEDNSITFDLSADQYHDYPLLPPNTGVEASMSADNWEYHFYRSIQAHEQSARWRVVVSLGEGVLVTVRNNRCPLQATWTREIWCDANYFGNPYICDIEIPTEAAHPGNNAFFISVYGKNATYTLAYWRGLENCHLFTHDGLPEGLNFCSGIVNYPTWRWDDYAALDAEASCFFEELYDHFRVQPCWSGVTTDCNSTLQQFACYESFKACDANGFYVGTCRSECNAVVHECVNWFESVDLEHYNCSSSRYIDDVASTCTGSGAWTQFDYNTQLFFGGNPADIIYDSYINQEGSASTLIFSCLLFVIVLLF